MLDLQTPIAASPSAHLFDAFADEWVVAHDRYLEDGLAYPRLLDATRRLLTRVYPRLALLELAYDDESVLTGVMATTDSGERYPLPSFDDRLPHAGPPWFEHAPFDECPELMDVLLRDTYGEAFDQAARVVTAWLDGITTQYPQFQFIMQALAFVARDSEGALTELTIR